MGCAGEDEGKGRGRGGREWREGRGGPQVTVELGPLRAFLRHCVAHLVNGCIYRQRRSGMAFLHFVSSGEPDIDCFRRSLKTFLFEQCSAHRAHQRRYFCDDALHKLSFAFTFSEAFPSSSSSSFPFIFQVDIRNLNYSELQ